MKRVMIVYEDKYPCNNNDEQQFSYCIDELNHPGVVWSRK